VRDRDLSEARVESRARDRSGTRRKTLVSVALWDRLHWEAQGAKGGRAKDTGSSVVARAGVTNIHSSWFYNGDIYTNIQVSTNVVLSPVHKAVNKAADKVMGGQKRLGQTIRVDQSPVGTDVTFVPSLFRPLGKHPVASSRQDTRRRDDVEISGHWPARGGENEKTKACRSALFLKARQMSRPRMGFVTISTDFQRGWGLYAGEKNRGPTRRALESSSDRQSPIPPREGEGC
jgi:hypothetical protein